MLSSSEFRELLVADVALVMGVAQARDVAAALQRYWDHREQGEVSLASELQRIAGLSAEDLQPVLREVDRLVAQTAGDARVALTRRGGLDRTLHVALSQHAAHVSRAVTQIGAGIRAPLRSLPEDRYVDFLPAGEGGMGVVYMALDTELNRLIAFKMVRPDVGSGKREAPPTAPAQAARPPRDTPASQAFEALEARFLQEAWVTGGMEHPGVVPVYELGQTSGGVPYYTMRFVRGQRTLKDALDAVREGAIEDRLQLIEPFLKLCDTVRYAHSRGVVHRDLKPENVALGEFGEVVLLDWGLAKLEGREDLVASRWQERVQEFRDAGDLRTVAGSLGTPGYMAPEAALGRVEQVDTKSDVYSLGVVLYEILTGRLPYVLTTYARYLDSVSREDPPPASEVVPDVPQGLSDLCARCLERDRGARVESVDALTTALRAWQAASAIEREVDGHLRDARAALAAAETATAEGRLRQVDRAAAAIQQAANRQKDNPAVARERRRVSVLREQGIRERERASGRRLLVRVGLAALILLAIGGFVVAAVVNAERAEKGRALDQVKEERDAKGRALEEVERLADSKEVRDLLDEAERLWPRHPDRAPAMAAWIDRAGMVLRNRPLHEAALAALRERALPYADVDRERDHAAEGARLASVRRSLAAKAEEHAKIAADETEKAIARRAALDEQTRKGTDLLADLEVRMGERRTWRFADARDSWKHQTLSDLLVGLTSIEPAGESAPGALQAIRTRLEFVSTLRQRSILDAAGRWMETIGAIADVGKNPVYGGLVLTPQLGLVPLGPDPDSHLFEFAHLGSGSLPTRDSVTGRLVLPDDAAIVLVLIPGATFFMGSQKDDPGKPNHDPAAGQDEFPVHEVTLSPYFIAKHECTQAQWMALAEGANPSRYGVGVRVLDEDVTARHPVEHVSWADCVSWLGRGGLALPGEAQWEHACRAGTHTPWFMGHDVATLGEFANVADGWLKEHGGGASWTYSDDVQDGHGIHAPVGSYKPNGFGLHDTHGNVWEWCFDRKAAYGVEAATDPVAEGVGYHVCRGGSWNLAAAYARSAFRFFLAPESRYDYLGVRPARPVTPD